MTDNTLARIGDRYWILRTREARITGVAIKLGDGMYSVYSDAGNGVFANLDAVAEWTGSQELDYRLTPELATTLVAAQTA